MVCKNGLFKSLFMLTLSGTCRWSIGTARDAFCQLFGHWKPAATFFCQQMWSSAKTTNRQAKLKLLSSLEGNEEREVSSPSTEANFSPLRLHNRCQLPKQDSGGEAFFSAEQVPTGQISSAGAREKRPQQHSKLMSQNRCSSVYGLSSEENVDYLESSVWSTISLHGFVKIVVHRWKPKN